MHDAYQLFLRSTEKENFCSTAANSKQSSALLSQGTYSYLVTPFLIAAFLWKLLLYLMTASIQPRIILASASPRRKQLLSELGLAFEVIVADVTEHEDPTTDPKIMVAHNAALKADYVAKMHPDAWVLGADTTVFIDQTVLNKPANLAEARTMLKHLSGRTHVVFTGVAVRQLQANIRIDRGISSEVMFKAFDDAVIDAYFKIVNPLDKAGAYGIQEGRDLIIAGWKGSFTNIMGLPMEAMKLILTDCGLLG